jgi:tetratricopeptide (TPR) repeat protein
MVSADHRLRRSSITKRWELTPADGRAQLTDANHGGQIWADRFDGELDGIFEMQDRAADYVSTKIAPALQTAEVRRSERKPTENLSAYDLYLRASRHQRQNIALNKESLRLLYRAIELDPSYGAAYALAAFCFFWRKVFGWLSPSDPAIEGVRLARVAVETAEEDSEALWMAAQSLGILAGDLDAALELVEKSTRLNPSSPSAWWTSCLTHAFLGQVGPALEHGARAHRLNPLDSLASTHANAIGLAHFFAGQYEEADRIADRVLAKEPLFLPALRLKLAVCGRLGHIEEGKVAVQRLLVVRPGATVKEVQEYYSAPLRLNPAGLEAFLEGLRLSGLPER